EAAMAADEKTQPRVYLFKDDYDMIHELVRRRPREETGGDLFGLWTSDNEPVLHIVTGQGIEIVRSPQQVFSSNNASVDSRIEGLSAKLQHKFHLIHLGKWQYKRRSEQTEAEIIATVGQKTLYARAKMKDFLLLLASCDDQSLKVELNPYFLSQFSTTAGEVADALPGRSIFKKDDEIVSTVDSLIFREDKRNRASLPTKQPAGENGKEMEARPSKFVPLQVAMRITDQKESYENQPSEKITSKGTEIFLKSGDPNLKLYVPQDHLQTIKDVVGCHPDAEAGGDLYGLWTNDGEPVLYKVTNAKNSATEMEILSKAPYLDCLGTWKYKSVGENSKSAIEQVIHKSTRPGKRGPVFLMVECSKDKFMSAFLLSDEDSSLRNMEIEFLDRKEANIEEKCTDKDERFEETDRGERRSCSDPAVPVLHRFETGFTCNQRGFKVYLFQDDCEMMRELVLRHPNVETGGDLFGLWTSDGDAVLHMVLGPGQNCKRTPTSFYQDIPYLQDKGEMLTTMYMLCHIGEWHSHHQLHLYEPSRGDSSTVIRHYPHGTCGFLLIIANIISHNNVLLSPYLYTERSIHNYCQEGELSLLGPTNAFKNGAKIKERIEEGREIWPHFPSGMPQYSQRYHSHSSHHEEGESSQSTEPQSYDNNQEAMDIG
ncbi:hypothetical protein AWC38_SpisGene24917, partial [Stylophora pistillata]